MKILPKLNFIYDVTNKIIRSRLEGMVEYTYWIL